MRNCENRDNASTRPERSGGGPGHRPHGLLPCRRPRPRRLDERAQQHDRETGDRPRRPPLQPDDPERLADGCGTHIRRAGRAAAARHPRCDRGRARPAGNAVGHAAHQRLRHGGTRDPLAAGAGVPPPLAPGACRSRHRGTVDRHRRRWLRSRRAPGRPRAERHDCRPAGASAALCRRGRALIFREAREAAGPSRSPRSPMRSRPPARRFSLPVAVRESRAECKDRRQRADHPRRGQPFPDRRDGGGGARLLHGA